MTYVASLIPPPSYRFGRGIDYVAPRGLLRYGPLKPLTSDVVEGRVFYVAHPNDLEKIRSVVEDFSAKLINGSKCDNMQFNGFESYFKCRLSLDLVPVEVDDIDDVMSVSEAVRDSVISNPVPVPIVVLPPHPRNVMINHYYSTKTLLASAGIYASQIIRFDTLEDKEKMCLSLLPISLQLFTKLGGVPYSISKPVGGTGYKTLLLGVGLTKFKVQSELVQYMGVVTLFAGDGTFRFVEVSITKLDKRELVEGLSSAIVHGVTELQKEHVLSKDEKIWIVVHYSGKEISRQEEEVIETTCSNLSKKFQAPIEPAIIKVIDDTIYRVFDERADMYPSIGSYIELIPSKLYILNTLGFDPHIGGSRRPEMPKPLLISVKKAQNKVVRELLYSVLALARVNFSGMQMFYRRPATISYARKAARLLSHMFFISKMMNLKMSLDSMNRKSLWFI